jgi:hypothetical protein
MTSPPVVLLGEQAPPRVHVAPERSRSNSWADVADLSAAFGIELDQWQETVLEAALGERADGKWSALTVALSAPRQNGKSQLIVARGLAGALLFGERKIVISAHQQDTARETFAKFMELIESNPALEARLHGGSIRTGVMNAINREHIKFANGSRIQFKARTRGGSRGFSADCLMLDEAQHLPRAAWVSINSTMSAMRNPQIWLMGTPPTPEDDGAVFASVRRAAMEGAKRAAYLEWSAEPTDDPALEATRRKANPAWDTRINHEVVEGEFATYSREEFALDRLGIWTSDVGHTRLITAAQWAAAGVAEAPKNVIGKSFGVAFSVDGRRVSVAGAARHADGIHVEIVGRDVGNLDAGITALADWLAERRDDVSLIVLAGRAGSTALQDALIQRRVRRRVVHTATFADYTAACASFYDGLLGGSVTHLTSEGQRVLDDSVAACDKDIRTRDGAWGWKAMTPDGDDTPIEAVSLAHWAAKNNKRASSGRAVFG